MRVSESTVPLRKVIEEMCPSPVAPQAQQEASRSGLEPRLVGVPEHRGIKEGRRFERVFLGEIGPDQEPAVFTEGLIGQKILLHLLEAVQEERAGFLMTIVKLAHHVAERKVDVLLGERHQPGQDPLDALGIGQLERANDDPAVGGLEHDAGSPDLQSTGAISVKIGSTTHDWRT